MRTGQPSWPCRARCVSEQRALTSPALWADRIPRFCGGAGLPSRPPVLLDTGGHAPAPSDRPEAEGARRLFAARQFGPLWAGSASTGSPAPGWSPPTATAGSWPRTLTTRRIT